MLRTLSQRTLSSPVRTFATRPAGPGGLFRSRSATVNPSRLQRQAARTRLHRARNAVELRQTAPDSTEKLSSKTITASSAPLPVTTSNTASNTTSGKNSNSNPDNPHGRPDFETEGDITAYVESRIEESMRAGDFDNLRNKGRPLGAQPRSATEYAMRIMRDAGIRPPWLQLMHDIDDDIATLRRALVAARRRHLIKTCTRSSTTPTTTTTDSNARTSSSSLRSKSTTFARTIIEARVTIEELNTRIDKFNIVRPVSFAHLFRLRLRIDDEVRRAIRVVAVQRVAEREATAQTKCGNAVSDDAETNTKKLQANEPPQTPAEAEPRPAWQLFARFVRASDVREYDMVSWGRRRGSDENEVAQQPVGRKK